MPEPMTWPTRLMNRNLRQYRCELFSDHAVAFIIGIIAYTTVNERVAGLPRATNIHKFQIFDLF